MPWVPGWDLWLKAVFLAERAAFQAGTGTENALRLEGTIPTVQLPWTRHWVESLLYIVSRKPSNGSFERSGNGSP